jgi:hypothetical protein
MKQYCPCILYSCFSSRIVAESVRPSNSVIPTSRPNGSSSGNEGPGYSPDIPDRKNQRAAGPD